jgi:hypothetical protein
VLISLKKISNADFIEKIKNSPKITKNLRKWNFWLKKKEEEKKIED